MYARYTQAEPELGANVMHVDIDIFGQRRTRTALCDLCNVCYLLCLMLVTWFSTYLLALVDCFSHQILSYLIDLVNVCKTKMRKFGVMVFARLVNDGCFPEGDGLRKWERIWTRPHFDDWNDVTSDGFAFTCLLRR